MSVLQRDMNESRPCHGRLSDRELVAEVTRLASAESQSTAALISSLAEFDARRLYLGQGCSSMFTYCTQVLHLAEHAAYNRIEAARAARHFPIIVELLTEGRIHLSALRLLAPHLTDANHFDVLGQASHKTKREIEEIVARLQPRPDVAPSVRKLPSVSTPRHTQAAPSQPVPPEATAASKADASPARVPNSRFVALVAGRDVVRVEPFGDAWIEIENRIRVILNTEWDPIAVAQADDDEYDGYISCVLSLLRREASAEAIAEHLKSIEVERMELRGSSPDKLMAVAEALRNLQLP